MRAALAQVRESLADLRSVDLSAAGDDELLDAAVESRALLLTLSCLDADILGRFSTSGAWSAEARSVPAWFLKRTNADRSETVARLRLARLRARHPVMAMALENGEVSAQHLRALGTAHHRVPALAAALDAVEPIIVDYAKHSTSAELRAFLHQLALHVVPDAVDEQDREALEDRAHLEVTELLDGWVAVSGMLPPEPGGRFLSALRALNLPVGAANASDGTGPGGGDTPRPIGQRMMDALSRLLDHACDGMREGIDFPRLRGHKPTVIVTVPLDVLRGGAQGAASLLTPRSKAALGIPAEVARKHACDGVVRRLVLDAEGTPIDAGRRQRTVSLTLATAVQQRDRYCRWPGCRQRIDQVHHVVHWARGGATDLDNVMGLCWWHHHVAHDGSWTLHGNTNATVTLRRAGPRGRVITSEPPDDRHLTLALGRLRR